MKKINSSLLLLVLASSLGLQTTTALAATVETTGTSSSEITELENEESKEVIEDNPEINPIENVEEPSEPLEKPEVEVEKPTEETKEEPTKPIEETKDETSKDLEKPVQQEESQVTIKPEKIESVREETASLSIEQNYVVSTYSEMTAKADIHYNANKSTQDFINEIGESARKIGQENDLYASVMIAQAILESAGGQSGLASAPNYNLFGIKGDYKGESVSFATNEDDGSGHLYTIQSNFRKYPSYKESLEDYAELMTKGIANNADFYQGIHKSEAKTYQEATEFLTGKYATDIYYSEKLNALIEAYHLESFDKEKVQSESLNLNDKTVESFTIENPINHQSSNFIIPLEQGYVVSSLFEHRDNPVTGAAEHHDGIDLAVAGGTPIYASNAGVVIQSGFESSAGNYVMVQHENGIITNYFHMSNIAVNTGEQVNIGDVLGAVGTTGNSTGNHLHFGLSTGVWSGYLNPSDYFNF